eukprot:TRINITY_DN19891_c1_g2_i3.p1 TRINITY_DN19891_c1_g2~~TRINITY_DN19891_c1_g2_i3.p1  ORF type:complete len:772 (-),score=130.17 TRINITY_DN19891_c1_g2_i3:156-2219(-)
MDAHEPAPSPASARALQRMWQVPLTTQVALSKRDLPQGADLSFVSAQWVFSSPIRGDRVAFDLQQGTFLVVKNPDVLWAVLDAGVGAISTDEGAPPEIRELRGLGELHLLRGGDLTGSIEALVHGSLEEGLSELIQMQSEDSKFVLQEPWILGGRTVPKGAKLVGVRFCPPGTEPQLGQAEKPEDFVGKAERRLEGLCGVLALEFQRPNSAEDVRRELCELLLQRAGLWQEEDPLRRPWSPSSSLTATDSQQAGGEEARAGLGSLIARARGADPAKLLPLDLRIGPQASQVRLEVHRQPSFGCVDEVLVMARKGHHWLVQMRDLEHFLGMTAEIKEVKISGSSTSLKTDASGNGSVGASSSSLGSPPRLKGGNRGAKSPPQSPSRLGGCREGFIANSAWRTRDGGVVMIHNCHCFGGLISATAPRDTYLVEIGELLGMSVRWRPAFGNLLAGTVQGWYEGDTLYWFDDPATNKETGVSGLSLLPAGPWVRIKRAAEEGGVPGPDGGLWTLERSFFAECNGLLMEEQLERLAEYQAGIGARELHERTRLDAQAMRRNDFGLAGGRRGSQREDSPPRGPPTLQQSHMRMSRPTARQESLRFRGLQLDFLEEGDEEQESPPTRTPVSTSQQWGNAHAPDLPVNGGPMDDPVEEVEPVRRTKGFQVDEPDTPLSYAFQGSPMKSPSGWSVL